MAFETYELSVSDGRPIEFLQIRYGNAPGWYYTTNDRPIDFLAETHYPLAIDHPEIAAVSDATRASLRISIPESSTVGELFRVQPPSGLVIVTLFQAHAIDNSYQVAWKGRITNYEWDLPWMHMNVENVFSSLQRPGLRRRISPQCQQVLYECGVNKELYRSNGTVGSMVGKNIVVPLLGGFDPGYFDGGFVEWFNPSLMTTERRGIIAYDYTGGGIRLSALPVAMEVGTEVSAFPGCSRLVSVCNGKFLNELNTWAIPYTPKKNPFGGTMLY